MKNSASKIIILAIAVAVAIGSVLSFIKYVVNPPEDISATATAEHVFNPDIKEFVASYNPDSLSLKEAEVSYDALVDRSTIFNEDELITDKEIYKIAIAELSEKFSRYFVSWSIDKFNKSVWNEGDHNLMLRLISKMRKVSFDDGSKKALSSDTLSSLTGIESVINDYRKAWNVASKTNFSSYQGVKAVRDEARSYATKQFLSNCTNLVNALNAIGEKQESSCYNQLYRIVERLQYLYYFENRKAYENESRRIFGLIKEFKDTNVFGISTANHASTLADMQDRYDRNAENHEWPDER